MMRKIYIPYIIFALIILLIPVFIHSYYYLGVLIQAGYFSLICMGLSLVMGYAGQISLGHAAFFGLGGYASAILTGGHGWCPWLAMLAAMIISGVLAWLIGKPSLKLKGHYLAMATLGFGEIVYIFFNAEIRLTGGPSGYTMGVIPYLTIGNLTIDNEFKHYLLTWAIVLLILLVNLHIIHSRLGRALRAIHADEEAARAMGVHTARFKVWIFVLSAVYASLAGSLYAHNILFVAPGPFAAMHSILFVTMVIVGGMGSIWGAVAGALLLTILPETLRGFQDYNILIYGGILLFIMLFMSGGLFGGGRLFLAWLSHLRGRKKEVADG
ncbi:MAG TPA: branched-chain amino acid ABC transporter permease [Candidatus Sumerlaeota bacterium]|nr:branched-chain amino acid ABC transporter permease [Candidatus Sumerlaeota bacterium]HRR31400.1 branched-chain amino acid ABC transporter permease [Candidatus Sumerlaeia bacterium]HON50268.1 branched-chain amino acid ABC transporter permease [Candidatus Sumerlaeota bacterium]HOR63485.1 branched-chain amino acid ABC transporter permease [Candidatus Sumerlaeota bacterium]HPL73450.1 branched-chain amino acid ABC transporter permease [Candidatus Sumerlaeota bacterium]